MADMPAKIRAAYQLARSCTLCPRRCGVDRFAGERGFCHGGPTPRIADYGPHFGEESVLVGRGGSGTIFLSGCNLRCVFCQNADISHGDIGSNVSIDELVRIMLGLQETGCRNVNFVTPTHYAPWLADAVVRARRSGLAVPIVYNCGGYESVEALSHLEGVVDIYMPDAKFADPEVSARLAHAPDYFDVLKDALVEMHRQVGDLVIRNGLAVTGLLVRHLVMPHGLAGTREILSFIAHNLSPRTFVNVMGQYRPAHHAVRLDEIARRPTASEIAQASTTARQLGLSLEGEIH